MFGLMMFSHEPSYPLLVISFQSVSETDCPSSWLGYEGNCYMIQERRLDWIDAQAACEKIGAGLAKINDLGTAVG